ncbi:type II toxin-antitoxin system RelE/ParE family toxin [Bacillus daqingensis]|uniref:Type II toxin-antitoxin system RelE/ParE family toxin n=1 Tax=Bacillus daqingensis TaxID=872396 RepID=A0ABV9NTT5_9BACI
MTAEQRVYEVRFEKRARKTLKKLDASASRFIMAWIKKNLHHTTDPRSKGKGLTGDRSGAWRYRVGDYRLIAEIQDKKLVILVLEIGHRKDTYG